MVSWGNKLVMVFACPTVRSYERANSLNFRAVGVHKYQSFQLHQDNVSAEMD